MWILNASIVCQFKTAYLRENLLKLIGKNYAFENHAYWGNQVIFNRPFHRFFKYSDLAMLTIYKAIIVEIGSFD
jgi:hypothetical protein